MNDLGMIKGIGPKTKTYLEKLGIFKIDDLVCHYPFRYEILKRSDILNLDQDERIVIDGYIDSVPTLSFFKRNMNRMSFRLRTNIAIINVVIFNRAFLKQSLELNKVITVIGKWDKIKNTIMASDIKFESLSDEPKIEAVYHTTSGITQKNLNRYINEALNMNLHISDYIPSPIAQKYSFLDKITALRVVHHPSEVNILKKALIRLKYEELFMFMLKISILKDSNKNIIKGHAKKIDAKALDTFINSLPFKLTDDQMKAIDEIMDDISSDRIMNRLLQGDVGSGKTVVAVVAIYMMCLNHYQSALMVPTEILAKQHYDNIRKLFNGLNIRIRLLVGNTPKKEKNIIYEELKNGDIDLIIGTHAIMQDVVEYHNLGLVITDEQHRFGVNQRSNLKNKGARADVLYMSATPIPRTYALTIYGDMDISSIKTRPNNRKDIVTYLKKPSEIKDVLTMIKQELELSHQIYVVAPLIEENENNDMENVNKLTRQFELAFGKTYKIGMLHGKMLPKEKEEVMTSFAKKEINILISTTVIEVGIDVKDATMMVIFDAQRFGLSTLHQLRGRVGRSDLQSYCILISDLERERLKIMTETNDGFEISEEDFRLRGQGDLFGVRQSGDMSFKIADIKKDFKILMQAKEDASIFVKNHLLDQYPHIHEAIKGSVNLD